MLKYDIESITRKTIENEQLQEITSPRLFIRQGEPDPEGLASYEIFGFPGTDERKTTFAYISLNDIFIHPHVFNELRQLRRDYESLCFGEDMFYLDGGTIVKIKNDEDAPPKTVTQGTGIHFLYKIWDKLDFEYEGIEEGMRKNRLRFFKHLKKEEVFITNWIVIPPFYRDVDMQGNRQNELNGFYIKLINLAKTIKSSQDLFGDEGSVSDSHILIMKTLVEQYRGTMDNYGGTKGFIHKHIMGKATDFSSRLVLSGAVINADSTNQGVNKGIDFFHSRLPLFSAIKNFAPYIVYGVRKIIENYLSGSTVIWYVDENGNVSRKQLADNWGEITTSNYIYNLIDLFDESIEHRLDPFTVECEDGEMVPIMYLKNDQIYSAQSGDELIKAGKSNMEPMTLLHIFYMAAYNEIKDKHIYITRYPIEDQNNMYPSKIIVSPYINVQETIINGIIYPNFPVVNREKDLKRISTMFVDSLVLFPSYLAALGGDFDGDQVTIQGVWSPEANEEAHNHLHSLANVVNIMGKTMRTFGEVSEHTIFNLTRDGIK